jgi:hypothetical protein
MVKLLPIVLNVNFRNKFQKVSIIVVNLLSCLFLIVVQLCFPVQVCFLINGSFYSPVHFATEHALTLLDVTIQVGVEEFDLWLKPCEFRPLSYLTELMRHDLFVVLKLLFFCIFFDHREVSDTEVLLPPCSVSEDLSSVDPSRFSLDLSPFNFGFFLLFFLDFLEPLV